MVFPGFLLDFGNTYYTCCIKLFSLGSRLLDKGIDSLGMEVIKIHESDNFGFVFLEFFVLFPFLKASYREYVFVFLFL